MKGTINIELEGLPCALSYKYYPGDNDWDLTKGCHIDSGFSICRSTLIIFSRVFRPEIDTAIRQDLMELKKAA